ncbi:type IV pilus biogenesis protein PilM [Paucisalibacillus sp. EB02]|uniref:type IV pilus biogenesis protein PilM n=1 Tax=Paucisalibacillus sp. EB02 TaxID=1347087 RepID=UPI0004B0C9D9|nr:pilus assembly protein PilM [Paucisalibacillus sp. EB02]
MALLNNGRINMAITNRFLRYSYHKSPSIDSLVTHGEIELPEGVMEDGIIANVPVFEEVINKLVKENKWRGKKLFFCMPDDTVVIRKLQIPVSLTKEESIGYIKTQIGNSFYLPFTNPAIAVENLDADEKERNVLLYAYPNDKILAFKNAFEDKGLKPVVADLTSLSVYRYYYQQKQVDKENILLIHWNQDALFLTAFKEHKAVFTRHMKLSYSDEKVEDTKENINRLINEHLIEINRIIDFYQYSITKGQSSINLLLLSGDFPYLTDVRKMLSDNVQIPLHQFSEEKLPVKYLDIVGLAIKNEV